MRPPVSGGGDAAPFADGGEALPVGIVGPVPRRRRTGTGPPGPPCRPPGPERSPGPVRSPPPPRSTGCPRSRPAPGPGVSDSPVGSSPLNRLSLSASPSRLTSLPSVVGTAPAQLVAPEPQVFQAGEVAQLRGVWARSTGSGPGPGWSDRSACPRWGGISPPSSLFRRTSVSRLARLPKLRREFPAKQVLPEVQSGDPSVDGRDPVPLVHRLPGQPVGIVGPVLAAGGLVQGHQRHLVGQDARRVALRPAQLVAPQGYPLQGGQVAQLRRQFAAELVVVKVQVRQCGQAAQAGGESVRSGGCCAGATPPGR